MIGEVFGNYRIVRLLGQGGMGAVYLAEHIRISRQAAIKVLLPQYSNHFEGDNVYNANDTIYFVNPRIDLP